MTCSYKCEIIFSFSAQLSEKQQVYMLILDAVLTFVAHYMWSLVSV